MTLRHPHIPSHEVDSLSALAVEYTRTHQTETFNALWEEAKREVLPGKSVAALVDSMLVRAKTFDRYVGA